MVGDVFGIPRRKLSLLVVAFFLLCLDLSRDNGVLKLPSKAFVKRGGDEHSMEDEDLFDIERLPAILFPAFLPGNRNNKTALILHIGKAGGGTLWARITEDWNINIQRCHPSPCENKVQLWNRGPYMILTIRDPIDRFVSAFYWRLIVICDPNGDDRLPFGKGIDRPEPPVTCKKQRSKRTETQALFHRYGRDANVLAEALYDEDDPDRAERARADLREIKHAKYSISRWLDFGWKARAEEYIYPVVEEKPYDLVNQTDEAVRWLYGKLSFEGRDDFETRARTVQWEDTHMAASVGNETVQHSSKKTNKGLSAKGIDNIARFYREDYELLRELKQLACKSDLCHRAIQSILQRREDVLQRISISGNETSRT